MCKTRGKQPIFPRRKYMSWEEWNNLVQYNLHSHFREKVFGKNEGNVICLKH